MYTHANIYIYKDIDIIPSIKIVGLVAVMFDLLFHVLQGSLRR